MTGSRIGNQAGSPRAASRRAFLQTATTAGAALAVPTLVSARALGLEEAPPASDRIVMGAIGTGERGQANLRAFLAHPDVQVIAVCDVDKQHAAEAKQIVDQHYGNTDCLVFEDQLMLLREPGIEAVSIATPDHWHGLSVIQAAREGKDIYCETPLAGSIGEGRAVCDAVNRYGTILQTGSQERSNNAVRRACDLVINGRLGMLKRIFVNLPTNDPRHEQVRKLNEIPPVRDVPEGFNYDRWLGRTPVVPYIPERVHRMWRFVSQYGGGEMTSRGAHAIDLAQMFLRQDRSGPLYCEAEGTRATNGLYDAFMDFTFVNTYASGVQIIGSNRAPGGIGFECTEGSLLVRIPGGKVEATPPALLDTKLQPGEYTIGTSPGHHRNFLDCVRSRQQPLADHEVGHRTATICHANNLAMLLERPLIWNAESEQFVGDDEANSLLMPAMREPYSLVSM